MEQLVHNLRTLAVILHENGELLKGFEQRSDMIQP